MANRTSRSTTERRATADLEKELGIDPDSRMAARSNPRESWIYPGEERGYTVAIMGGAQRTGAWEPPETLYVVAFMGSVKLDFREAELLEGISHVNVLSFMGGVSIIVPPDLDLEVNGIGFMGSFAHLHQRPEREKDDDGSPLLEISGLAFMGGVEVKVR